MDWGTLITTCGIVSDILGAWLVAWEVVKRTPPGWLQQAESFAKMDMPISGTGVTLESSAHSVRIKVYLQDKRRMGWGLFCLTIGFVFQGIGAWWPEPSCVDLLWPRIF